jgi:GT2 family glycosyltransferase/SAM-dependent methyltransferase
LLRPTPDHDAVLDFDQLQRYTVTARLIDRLCAGLAGPVRVLEVGCNVLNHLPRFLDQSRARVVRCDTYAGESGDPDYVRIDSAGPLPFADESFDVVAAVEVLEHVPADRRAAFVADCLRVARHGAVFTCPDGTPAVRAAEGLAAAAYHQRHGRPHPFLGEHEQFGLPTEDEVRAILRRLDVPHAVVPNAPLDVWLASIVLSEHLAEGAVADDVRAEIVRAFEDRPPRAGAACYRKVYVCAKTFDATAALEPAAGDDTKAAPSTESSVPSLEAMGAALNHLAAAAGRALAAREFLHRTVPATLLAVIREQEKGLNAQEQRFIILRAFADALQQSATWRLFAPLRWLRHWLRPRGLRAEHLLPWKGLEPVADASPGTWRAPGDDPQFLVSCYLPAGWLRVRLRVHSPVRGQFTIYAEKDGSFGPDSLLGQFGLAAGDTDEEFYVHLGRPTRALRIDPVDAACVFRIDRLEIAPRPPYTAAFDALRRKLRLLRAYHNTGPVLRRGLALLATGRWGEVIAKWRLGLDDPRCTRHGFHEPEAAYEAWMANRRLTDAGRAAQRAWAVEADDPPLVSVLMPVYNTPEHYLRRAIESVLAQTYPHWELCVADDGSTAEHVRPVLEEYAARDDRVKLAPPGRHGGIAAASNAALALASGRYVALLDHDDEIAEHALYRMAQAIVADPTADMLYSDEDKLQPDGKRVHPFFKPDWSPEFFLGCMYTCHLGLYRTALVRELGGFRPTFDGAQDYDLVLRLTERTDRVVHVLDVLYHWRLVPNSTSTCVAAKPEAHAAGLRALQEHLARTGRAGRAEVGPSPGLNFVRFDVAGRPRVSIIIPSLCRPARAGGAGAGHLEQCVASIARIGRYKEYEILVLDQHRMPEAMERDLTRVGVRRVTYDEPFNWSRVNNLGARHTTGEHLLFLNDDTEVVAPDWLEALLEFSQQREIGAVGAKLLFPDGGLQHVGVTILDGKPGHPFYGYPAKHTGYFCRNVLPHNCAAVTGACLMTRRDVFEEAGGFDESFPLNYNDVDYCLRVRQLGYRVVFTPHATLHHHEAVSKAGVFAEELDAFRARWDAAGPDPYYNPNLNPETFDYRIGP